MSGVDIKSMNASDAIDVIHFIFEEDMLSSKTKEELEVKDSLRSSIYGQLYGVTYKYAKSTTNASDADLPIEDELNLDDEHSRAPVPLDPTERAAQGLSRKSFIPATNVNAGSSRPFGRDIDAPLG